MGACVSSLHNSSTMKVHVSSRSNRKPNNHVVIVPVKEKLPIVNGDVAVMDKPQWFPLPSNDIGSTEETFFDSQAWLDSDCESDFMSVNGEFTPSRGNTPVHHNFPTGPPQMKGGIPMINDHKPSMTRFEPSPSLVKDKKRLLELFSESQRETRNRDEGNGENEAVGSLEVAGLKPKKERWVEIVQVRNCLPRVHSEARRK
ncbi:hypothetical protein QVD17_06771 [Tagetes erecta]|uniref:Uncharacterized protein n=1 Tax=Tagetes erecta TaxID=13708 RepID=A0AAD8LLA8_TARER|nr:hypothetical protein QVD17_06771 [Tagetes erecta]